LSNNSTWLNEQLKALQCSLIDIDIALQYVSRIKPSLSDIAEQRQPFAQRHLNDFDISNKYKTYLYTKQDADDYAESLRQQKKATEARIDLLKGLGANYQLDRVAYLSSEYSECLAKIWTIDLEMSTTNRIKSSLTRSADASTSKEDFRRKHENEYSIESPIKPKLATTKDAQDYMESLRQQRVSLETRMNILQANQANTEYVGSTTDPVSQTEFNAHIQSTTTAHGGITPSSHMGSGGNAHALAVPGGEAGFISGEDLSLLRNSVGIDTTQFIKKTEAGNGPNQILRLDESGEVPDENIGLIDGGTF
jgi:hypothetical protein